MARSFSTRRPRPFAPGGRPRRAAGVGTARRGLPVPGGAGGPPLSQPLAVATLNSLRNQHTIGRPVHVHGFGYWSGRDVRVEFRPAAPHAGIVFVRRDLRPEVHIPALVDYRVEVPRRTNLARQGAAVEMVEHLLAALAGLQIDNCEVWLDQPEVPGCDGSSRPFVEALQEAGSVELPAPRPYLRVPRPIRVGDEQGWIEVEPVEHDGLELQYELDYGCQSVIGRQSCRLRITPDSFRRELAPARTFLLKQEADWLRTQGLGTRVTHRDLLVFDADGPIDNRLRFENECVRHKALDVVGDLALLGCDLVGRVTAFRSGHRLNAELVRALLQQANADPQGAELARRQIA